MAFGNKIHYTGEITKKVLISRQNIIVTIENFKESIDRNIVFKIKIHIH